MSSARNSGTRDEQKKRKFWIGPGNFPGRWGFARPWDTHFPSDTYPVGWQRSPTDFLPLSVRLASKAQETVDQLEFEDGRAKKTKALKRAKVETLVKQAKRTDAAYFDKRHEVPIRRLRHCTHLIEASGIVRKTGEKPTVHEFVFRGNRFGGSDPADEERRKHVPYVLERVEDSEDSESEYQYRESESCPLTSRTVGRLVWFGVEVDDEDVKNIKKMMDLQYNKKKKLGKKKMPSEIYDTMSIKDQFGTSPQFSESSRYGNLAFSLSTEEFVSAVQQCFRRDIDKAKRAAEEERSSPSSGRKRPHSSGGSPQAKRQRIESPGKRPRAHNELSTSGSKRRSSQDTSSMCYHCGGTLFYQREVTYVVLVTPKDKCKDFTKLGLPCFGANKSLLGRQPKTQDMAREAPDVGIPGGPISFSDHCAVEERPDNDGAYAKMLLKSTAEQVKIVKKATREKNRFTFYRQQYWESVVFAVATKRLVVSCKECDFHIVDHEINCCQPSLYLPREKSSAYGMRMNCHKGGYALAKDMKQALMGTSQVLQAINDSDTDEDL